MLIFNMEISGLHKIICIFIIIINHCIQYNVYFPCKTDLLDSKLPFSSVPCDATLYLPHPKIIPNNFIPSHS